MFIFDVAAAVAGYNPRVPGEWSRAGGGGVDTESPSTVHNAAIPGLGVRGQTMDVRRDMSCHSAATRADRVTASSPIVTCRKTLDTMQSRASRVEAMGPLMHAVLSPLLLAPSRLQARMETLSAALCWHRHASSPIVTCRKTLDTMQSRASRVEAMGPLMHAVLSPLLLAPSRLQARMETLSAALYWHLHTERIIFARPIRNKFGATPSCLAAAAKDEAQLGLQASLQPELWKTRSSLAGVYNCAAACQRAISVNVAEEHETRRGWSGSRGLKQVKVSLRVVIGRRGVCNLARPRPDWKRDPIVARSLVRFPSPRVTDHRAAMPSVARLKLAHLFTSRPGRLRNLLYFKDARAGNGGRNEGAGETGDPREDPPTYGIVQHDSHMRRSGVARGLNPDRLGGRRGRGRRGYPEGARRQAASSSTIPPCEDPRAGRPGIGPGSPWWEAVTSGATVAERLVCSTPTKVIRVQFPHTGIVQDNAVGGRVFSGISHFPLPFIPALLHIHLTSPSSALKTSILRAVQISSLTTHSLTCSGRLWTNSTLARKQVANLVLPGVEKSWLLSSEAVNVHISEARKFGRLLTSMSSEPRRVTEVSVEQRRNEGAGQAGDPRENDRDDSHVRKSGVNRPAIEPGSP
ncbi:hypothetical protein PR048_025766 [Dryococelus australis]|uniref:Uncharacterized protein n=1 Tax=Dryococelus australis TaxID=614101 RepID=A0ABQ9GJI7_9NEOP|nr:hypothetical protein PR048_025766 [Dryococelus australis]